MSKKPFSAPVLVEETSLEALTMFQATSGQRVVRTP